MKLCPDCKRPHSAGRIKCNACYMRVYLANPEKRKKHNHWGLMNRYKNLTGNFKASFEENYRTHLKNKMEKKNEPVKS